MEHRPSFAAVVGAVSGVGVSQVGLGCRERVAIVESFDGELLGFGMLVNGEEDD
jgi:hypothetical protein